MAIYVCERVLTVVPLENEDILHAVVQGAAGVALDVLRQTATSDAAVADTADVVRGSGPGGRLGAGGRCEREVVLERGRAQK
jgi:hypothetical protein